MNRHTLGGFALAALAAGTLAHGQDAPPAPPVKLHLVCQGERTSLEASQTTYSLSDDRDATRSASGDAMSFRPTRTKGSVEMAVDGETVRFNYSGITRPSASSKAPKDGWWDLGAVVIDANQIVGSFKPNVFQKIQVRVDRHTGAIRLSGLDMSYAGICEKSALPADAQKF